MYSVYVIEKENKIFYVGKTINFKRRIYQHRYRRKLDKTYTFREIEKNLTAEEAKKREKYYITKFNTFIDGWNKNKGEGNEGLTFSNGEKGTFTKGNEIWKKRPLKKLSVLSQEQFILQLMNVQKQ